MPVHYAIVRFDQQLLINTNFIMRYRSEGEAIMRFAKIIICILSIPGVCALAQRTSSQTPAQSPAKPKRIVIAATAVLDGKGRVLHNTRIVIEGSKIVAIDPKAGAGGLRPARLDGFAGLD